MARLARLAQERARQRKTQQKVRTRQWVQRSTLLVAIGVSVFLDSRFMMDYLSSVANLDAAFHTGSRVMSGLIMDAPAILNLNTLNSNGNTATSSTLQSNTRVLLEATVPQENIDKLYNETSHCPRSPLSPQFRGLLDQRRHNQKQHNNYVGCTPTAKVQVLQVQEQHSTVWTLQALDQNGNPKTVGGDEYYLTFHLDGHNPRTVWDPVLRTNQQHPNFVGIPTDLGNGQYSLEFFEPPVKLPQWNEPDITTTSDTDVGTLTIYLSYTCGMGLVTQKSDWHNNSRGSLDWKHAANGVSVPPWRRFIAPTMPSIIGPTSDTTHTKRLRKYDYVAFFGDSVLGLFVGQYSKNRRFNKYDRLQASFPDRDQFHYVDNIRRPYAGRVPELQQLFETWHGEKLRANRAANKDVAIVLGGGSWDLGTFVWNGGDENFDIEPTIGAHREFWAWLLKTFPGVPIYWKSNSAPHPHAVRELLTDTTLDPTDRDRIAMGTRYCSIARYEAFEERVRELLQEEPFRDAIGVLDVYKSTRLAAEWLFPRDTFHMNWEMNRHMLMEWFY